MPAAPQTLRDILSPNPTCVERVAQAESLSRALFNGDQGRIVLPYFTDHTIPHCDAVERHLDRMILTSGSQAEGDFIPTPEEAMYLLSAAWLHDLGMVYGIFDAEQPADLHDSPGRSRHHRDNHDERTSTFLLEHWKVYCNWERRERAYLANVCRYHRQHHHIDTFNPVTTEGRHVSAPVRLKVLAAILRVADGCHVDQSRAPGPLRALYDALGMPAESVCHWEASQLVTDIRFDHAEKKIVLTAEVPPPLDFGMGSFDFADLTNRVCESVEKELRSVHHVLAPFPNLGFAKVECNVNTIGSLGVESARRCLAVWPYLLHLLHQHSRSATEAAVAIIKLVLLAANAAPDFGPKSQRTVEAIMDEACRSRPFDLAIRNLRHEIRSMVRELSGTPRTLGERLGNYLTAFVESMNANTTEAAREAAGLVDPNDILLVYGYSTNIARFLEDTRSARNAPVYIVECSLPTAELDTGTEENRRIAVHARKLGLPIRFVSLASVAAILADLNARSLPCKLLLGTHGILRDGDLLCKIGTYSLALTARQFGVRVLAFAAPEKCLSSVDADEDIASPQSLAQSGGSRTHPHFEGAQCLTPTIDRVPRSLADKIVGERRVPADAIPTEPPSSQ